MINLYDRDYKCTICQTALLRDQVKCFYSANYCSDSCKSEAGRRYDSYVDPSGYYRAKAAMGVDD